MTFRNAFYQFWKFKETENQDIYSVLESVNWIWRATGVFIVVPNGPIGYRKFVTNKFLMIYNLLLLCLFIISNILLLYDQERVKIMSRLGVDMHILSFVRQSLNWTIIFDVIFWKMIVNNKFIETSDSLAKQDKVLKKLGSRLNYKSNSKIIKICVRSYLSIYLLTSCCGLFYGFGLWFVTDWMTGWLPIIVHKVNICLYLNLIWMLGVRFKALNKRLNFIVKSSNENSQVISRTEEFVVMLRTIGNIHSQLCKIGHSFNFIFIITLVTSALEIFVFVTLSFYSFIVQMKNDQDLLQLSGCTCLIITCSFPMITIVMICNWTKKQAYAAEKLIYKIKVQENNSVLSELVRVFSMQMQHQQLAFSVGGLFTLDPALLQAIMGAITTNLIILVQFGQLENILLKKT